MTLSVKLMDGAGKGRLVRISEYGIMATGPIEFSQAYPVEANVINTGFNFVGPNANKQFVITGISLYANKNVGANDASVEIYEATSDTSTTVDKLVWSAEMVKQTSRDLTGLNLIVSKGRWLNIKTDDATIFATIFGYYIPPIESA